MTTTFEDVIQEVVSDFLETALVVDDEALLPPPRAHVDGVDTDNGDSDAAGEKLDEESRGALSLDAPHAEALAQAGAEHPLFAKSLIDAFADSGIICSILALDEDDPIQERFIGAARRADLLIVDWELNRDRGETARKLIAAVVEQDSVAETKRLRVIALYTGQPGLAGIMEQLRDHLKLPKTAVRDDGLTLAGANVRITAFNKPFREKHLQQSPDREVAEAQLPTRLIREFACLTRGLVPAVALASLAAIRNDAHRILKALGPELDLGYLGHRVALPFPEDAQGHLVDMIVAEIGSVVGENDVGHWANLEVIKKWLALEQSADKPLVCGEALPFDAKFDREAAEKLLDIGLGLDDQLKEHEGRGIGEKLLKRVRKQTAHLFARKAASAEESSDLLAVRLAVRTVYTHPRRRLRLGTIVNFDGNYLVCAQPRCDSVRLPPGEARGFPFLPLEVVKPRPDVARDFVIEDASAGGLVSLRLSTKPYALSIHLFEGGDRRFVEAKLSKIEWIFKSARGRRFRWVAELKPEFAQRVAIEFAANAVRVGLAESELIRLSRPDS